MKTTLIISSLALACFGGEFNHESYIPCDLDSLIDSTPIVKKVKNSTKQVFDIYSSQIRKCIGKISRMPVKLDTLPDTKSNVYEKILKTISKQKIPPIKHVIEIETAKGRKIVMLIQTPLVEDIYNEAQVGTELELYCLHYFNDEEGPGLLISDFKILK